MTDYAGILHLLNEKLQHFLSFERITEDMLSCPTDELEAHVLERDKLINQIDRADIKIESMLVGNTEADAVFDAINGRSNRGDIEGVLGDLYDTAAAIRAVVVRIPDTDVQVVIRIGIEQEHILERIRSTNRGVEAQAARFAPDQPLERTGGLNTDA